MSLELDIVDSFKSVLFDITIVDTTVETRKLSLLFTVSVTIEVVPTYFSEMGVTLTADEVGLVELSIVDVTLRPHTDDIVG